MMGMNLGCKLLQSHARQSSLRESLRETKIKRSMKKPCCVILSRLFMVTNETDYVPQCCSIVCHEGGAEAQS